MKKLYQLLIAAVVLTLTSFNARAIPFTINVTWDNPGAVKITGKYASDVKVEPSQMLSSYTYVEQNTWYFDVEGIKIYPADGFEIESVKYTNRTGVERTLNKGYANYYTCNSNVFNYEDEEDGDTEANSTVVVTTKKLAEPDAKFYVTVVNTADCVADISLPGSKTTIKDFVSGVEKEIPFYSDKDSEIAISFNGQTWIFKDYVTQEKTEDEKLVDVTKTVKIYRAVSKITKNGIDITSDLEDWNQFSEEPALDGYKNISIADGDRIVITPFAEAAEENYYTVNVNASEGLIGSIFNRSLFKMVSLTDGKLTVKEGTVLQFNLDNEMMLESWSWSGDAADLTRDVTNNTVTLTVNCNGDLNLVAKAKEYANLNYTFYISNADCVSLSASYWEGINLKETVSIDLGEGTPVDSDIELPSVIIKGMTGVQLNARTMPAAQTKKYTVAISEKYNQLKFDAKKGAAVLTWRTSDRESLGANAISPYFKDESGLTFYVYAKEVEASAKAVVYVVKSDDNLSTISLGATDDVATPIGAHALAQSGYTEITFDPDFETTWGVKGVTCDAADASTKYNSVVVNGNAWSADPDSKQFSGFSLRDGSVVKVFADNVRRSPKTITINKQYENLCQAEIVYDRVVKHEAGNAIASYVGTEYVITPGEDTAVKIDGVEMTPNAEGKVEFTVSGDHTIYLAYTGKAFQYELTPSAEGDVESLKEIRIAFPYAENVELAEVDGETVGADNIYFASVDQTWAAPSATLVKDENAEVPTFIYTPSVEPVRMTGYRLMIPEGMFVVDGETLPGDIEAVYNLHYEVEMNYEITPTAGKMLTGEWASVGIAFDEALQPRVVDYTKITVVYNGVELTTAEYMAGCESNYFMVMVYSMPNTGTLTLKMEEGALDVNGTPSPAIDHTWNVVEPIVAEYVITPASGSELTSFDKFTIEFTNVENVTLSTYGGAELWDGNYSSTRYKGTITEVEGTENPTFEVTFASVPTKLTTYTLKFGWGTFGFDGIQDSEDIKAQYKLIDPLIDDMEFTPYDGEEVESLQKFTVSFPGRTDIHVDEEIAEDQWSLIVRDNAWTYYKHPIVMEVEDAECSTFDLWLTDAPTRGGEYVLVVPMGLFVAENGQINDEAMVTVTIPGGDTPTWTALPDEAITNTNIEDSENLMIAIMFDDAECQVEFGDPMFEIWNNDNELYYEGEEANEGFNMTADYNCINVTFGKTATANMQPGELTLYIAAGSLYINGEPFNDEIYAMWTVAGDYTGITGVEADSNAEGVEYYNLQGVRVAKPAAGFHIVVRGGKATKEIVK